MINAIEERKNNIRLDILKRKEIIKQVLAIGCESLEDVLSVCKSKEQIQKYYNTNYEKYLGRGLGNKKYEPSSFWFNNAGFQFQWRNFENIIQLECLTWDKVLRELKASL